jgi:hypothetical protein
LCQKVDPSKRALKRPKAENYSSPEEDEAIAEDMDFIEDDDVDYYERDQRHFFPFYYRLIKTAKSVYLIFQRIVSHLDTTLYLYN